MHAHWLVCILHVPATTQLTQCHPGMLQHIGFNMMSVYQLRSVEARVGSLQYTNITAALLLLPLIVTLGMFHFLRHRNPGYYSRSPPLP